MTRLLGLILCPLLVAAAVFASGAAVGAEGPGSVRVISGTNGRDANGASDDDRSSGPALRVITWNIDRGSNWRRLASELKTSRADLLLLQEVDWNTRRTSGADVASELAQCLHLNGVYATEFEELGQENGAQAYTGQATLSRLPVRRSRVLTFRHQSGFWQARPWLPSALPLLQRRYGARMALVTEFEWKGASVVAYNAHLESRSYGRIQMQQLDEILADAGSYRPGTAFLLAGDLNTKYLPALFLRKLERAGFRSCLGERVERTHTIAMALDWIFVKGPVQVEKASVNRSWRGSDHYPVLAELGRQMP